MNIDTNSNPTNAQTGFSRRQFLGKSLLATIAGAWLANSTSVGAAETATAATAKVAYQVPALTDKNAWTLVIIPDIQTYNKFSRNQGIASLMTAWIAENKEKMNILTALQVGDLVEQNGITEEDLTPERANSVNQTSAQQWNAASGVLSRLDGKLPYIVCTGNHDYGIWSAENRNTQFPTYFPRYRNSAWNGVLVECCKNRDGISTLENAAYALKTPQGKDLLFLSLEFAPSDPVLAWAKELVSRDAYKNHTAIVLTHTYMYSLSDGNALGGKEGYKITDVNYGKDIWEKLIYPSDNIRFVFCGHIAGPNKPQENVGFRQDKNHAGKTVSQMLFDVQTLGGGWHGNGGDGWIRLLEFSPDFKKVSVKTFSPLFAISPTTQHLAWDHEDYNEFTFDID